MIQESRRRLVWITLLVIVAALGIAVGFGAFDARSARVPRVRASQPRRAVDLPKLESRPIASPEVSRKPEHPGEAGVLDVRVLGGSENPLEGAHVIVVDSEPVPPLGTVERGRTDSDGRVRLALRREGRLAIVAWASGYLPHEKVLAILPPRQSVVLQLTKASTVRGRLVFADGRPAAGVRVGGAGLGYSPSSLSPEPVFRAFPGSGRGETVTGVDGRFTISGVGVEPVALHLQGGWTFAKADYSGGRTVNTMRPIVREGEDRAFVVWRRAQIAFRLLDASTRDGLSSCVLTVRIRDANMRIDPARGPATAADLGMARTGFLNHAFRGNGVHVYRVLTSGTARRVKAEFRFHGLEGTHSFEAVVLDYGAEPVASELPVVMVVVKRRFGRVRFRMPASFTSRRFPFLLCVANAGDGSWTKHHATRDGDSDSYDLPLPAGPYRDLIIGDYSVRQCRSGPFVVNRESSPALQMRLDASRVFTLLVRTIDTEGRPLLDCGLLASHGEGRELKAIGFLEFGSSNKDWPLRLLVRRERLEPTAGNVPTLLSVLKPGFRPYRAEVVLDLGTDGQEVSVVLARDPEGSAR